MTNPHAKKPAAFDILWGNSIEFRRCVAALRSSCDNSGSAWSSSHEYVSGSSLFVDFCSLSSISFSVLSLFMRSLEWPFRLNCCFEIWRLVRCKVEVEKPLQHCARYSRATKDLVVLCFFDVNTIVPLDGFCSMCSSIFTCPYSTFFEILKI